MKLIYGYCCEQGTAKQKNQDAMIFKSGTICKTDVCVAAVCDGVGSFDGSGYASGFVAGFIGEWFDSAVNDCLNAENTKRRSAKTVYEELKNSLREKLWLAHKIVSDEAAAYSFEAGTTVCAIMVVAGRFYCIYSTGDSRAYEIGRNMDRITEDHVVTHNGKEVLSNCLGRFPGPDFKRLESKISKNKTYMLASDGFYRRLNRAETISGFKKAKTCEAMDDAVKNIRKYTAAAGEHDDSTGIALKFI